MNLSAFVVRFNSTRDSATGWPTRRSTSGMTRRTARLFSSASGRTIARTESTSSVMEKGVASPSASSLPPRANSIASLTIELSPSAAL